mgnify:CR=1 FL=1
MSKEVYTVSIPNLPLPTTRKNRKLIDGVIKLIKKQDGFIGLSPEFPHGTILFFGTLNDAKRARNNLRAELNAVGTNICAATMDESGAITITGKVVG